MSNRLLAGVVVIVAIIAATAGFLLFTGFGTGSGDGGPSTPEPFGDGLMLDRVEFGQNGETHVIPAGTLHNQVPDVVLNEGFASLTLTFKSDEGEVEGREVTLIDRDDDARQPSTLDAEGKAVFFLNLTLEGHGFRWNPYALEVEEEPREFEVLTIRANGPGDVTDTPNTPSEIDGHQDPNRPYTIGPTAEIDPVFIDAFARFCGFTNKDIEKVRLEPNDRVRFQVAWTGSSFVEAHSTIDVGQPVWVAISKGGDRCYINPPCGNPEVPQGKLPPAPPELRPSPTPTPGEEVTPTATRTPEVSSPTPSATKTTVVPSSTPKLPTATPTQKPPTATPRATQTAAPTQKPCCTPVPDYTRPADINTPVNTIAVPTETPIPVQTTKPGPTATFTPGGGSGCGYFGC